MWTCFFFGLCFSKCKYASLMQSLHFIVCRFITAHIFLLLSSSRSRGWPVLAFFRLLGRLLLRPPFLDKNLQTGAEAGRSVHQAEEERHSRLGTLPALWLCQGPLLQGVERRHLFVQVQTPHVPEDLKQEAAVVGLKASVSMCEGIFFFLRMGCGGTEKKEKTETDKRQNRCGFRLAILQTEGKWECFNVFSVNGPSLHPT